MLALWSVLALSTLLCSAAVGATPPRPAEDDPIVETINEVITKANNYFKDHLLTYLPLPNIGVLPWDPVKLTEGRVSQFDTIQLAGTPTVHQRHNPDNSTTYTYDINLSLDVILVQYQFHASFLDLYSQDGQLALSPQKNALRAKGVIVVGPGSSCSAKMSSAEVVLLEGFQIDIEPSDIPFVGKVSEILLDYFSPRLLWVLDAVIKAVIFSPSFQNNLSDFVCTTIVSN